MKLTIDFETRSVCDIKKHGAWVYSEHQNTDALMLAVMADDKPMGIWMNKITGCEGIPKERIFELMDKADIIEAHNVGFERAIWQNVCRRRYGWPELPIHKLRCSMAQCAYHSLPMGLDAASAALGLGGKDKDGYKLMLKLSKPRKIHPDGSITWWGDEAMFARLADYCMQDVIAEHAISEALYPLPDSELAIWQLDQEINARGVLADVASCKTAIHMIEEDSERSLGRFKQLTHGSVASPKQITAFLKWLASHGCVLPGLTKADVAAGLGMEIRPEVREALQIRQKLGLSSVSKFQAILDRVSHDGRLRGAFAYHGAGTGRWSGRGVQLQNLPRKAYHDADIAALEEGDTNWFDMTEENIPAGMSKMVRGMFMAGPGNELAVADFSSIEARGLAWEAREEKVLQAFRNGECAYCLAASAIYGRSYKDIWSGYKVKDKASSDQRQVGKTAILACGYQGSVGAFQNMAQVYNVKVPDAMAQDIVTKWRAANPAIVSHWAELEKAMVATVETGRVHTVEKVKFGIKGRFLCMKLPSGRSVHYPFPKLEERETKWGSMKRSVTFMNASMGKWFRDHTYGGRISENETQAICRDLLAFSALRVEKEGFPVVLHVHDEVGSEIPKGAISLKDYEALMAQTPDWAEGFPVKAEGYISTRYRK